MSIIQERLSKDNTGILGTLPSARLSYVREVFLGSRKIYYHQKALPSNSTSGWVTQNLIHLFKNTSDFNNTLYSVNCFLFVRSNLEKTVLLRNIVLKLATSYLSRIGLRVMEISQQNS